MEIGYFPTSVQKLYKINDGEWQTYTGKIRLEIDDIVYAKGIDVDNNETRIVSEDKAVLPVDGLGANAYDGKTSTEDKAYPTVPKKIYVSTEMQGKEFYVVGNGANGSNIIIKSYDKEGNSTDLYASNKIEQNLTIPSDCVYIEFNSNYADFGCNIKHIEPVS